MRPRRCRRVASAPWPVVPLSLSIHFRRPSRSDGEYVASAGRDVYRLRSQEQMDRVADRSGCPAPVAYRRSAVPSPSLVGVNCSAGPGELSWQPASSFPPPFPNTILRWKRIPLEVLDSCRPGRQAFQDSVLSDNPFRGQTASTGSPPTSRWFSHSTTQMACPLLMDVVVTELRTARLRYVCLGTVDAT